MQVEIETDSQGVFESAMGRAISHHAQSRELVECSQARGVMSFGPSRGQSNCEGEDLNAAIASTMDEDEELKSAVESILSVEWPTVDFTPKELPSVPLTGEAPSVRVIALAQAFLSDSLAALEADLERDLIPIQAMLESGEESAKEEALQQAAQRREAYDAQVAAEGERLFEAMEAGLKKQSVALCPNPPVFGGCPGDDQTQELIQQLQDSRRFRKALD